MANLFDDGYDKVDIDVSSGKIIRTAITSCNRSSIVIDTSSYLSFAKVEIIFQTTPIEGLLARHCLSTIRESWMGARFIDARRHILRRFFNKFVRDIARDSDAIGYSIANKVYSVAKDKLSKSALGPYGDFRQWEVRPSFWAALTDLDDSASKNFFPLDILAFRKFDTDRDFTELSKLLELGGCLDVKLIKLRRRQNLEYSRADLKLMEVILGFNEFARNTFAAVSMVLTFYLRDNIGVGAGVVAMDGDIKIRAHRVRALVAALDQCLTLNSWASLTSSLLLLAWPAWEKERKVHFRSLDLLHPDEIGTLREIEEPIDFRGVE